MRSTYLNVRRAGFSLVEMSVILAVIGLLVGTVLVASTMIEASKINKTISLIRQYESGVNQFKEQYGSWPGDFGRAEELWGTETVVGGTGTRNGTGNGWVGDGCWGGNPCETFRAYEHLSLSGATSQTFTGVADFAQDAVWGFAIDQNVPKLPLFDNAVLLFMGMNDRSVLAYSFLTHPTPAAFYLHGTSSMSPCCTVDHAQTIDSKIDDGQPHRGVMTVYEGATCVTGVYPNVTYLTTNRNVRGCIMVYNLTGNTQ